ncbi:receptor like protein 46 [Abeliophyllum distichum]|uniref:Receptor like protein 46 n=1 Tax=Abeliophyllum distichum TaxID=126358 RepID=A0ABD1VS34_9LAMI
MLLIFFLTLGLTGNNLTSSSVFPWLFNFSSSLSYLDINNNNLQGPIPNAIGNIAPLRYLFLQENQLEDGIPSSFGNLSSIEVLVLSDNQLTGTISVLLSLSSLMAIDVRNNLFNGILTERIGSLSKLEYLDLGTNRFEGVITEAHFFSLSRLYCLFLDYNSHISFNLSSGWNPPFQLQYLGLRDCKLGPHFPTWLQTQKALYYLEISNTEIQDPFPDWFWDLTPKLYNLNASHNNIHGVLPDLSSKFSAFSYIDLSFNHFKLFITNFTGEIPASLRKCTSLRFADLSENKFSGEIPAWVGDSLSELVLLSLRSNQLFGTIPLNLCDLTCLQVLDISLNKISGAIPNCLSNLTAMVQKVEFESYIEIQSSRFNHFEGAEVTWKGKENDFIKSLKLVKLIDLSSNILDGEIPTEITSLVTLVGLNLSRNNLSGSLPLKIGELRSLDFLDLSRNHLSGGIPVSLSQLDQLGMFDLSYNNLSGRIPFIAHLQTFESSAYVGNSGLCGPSTYKTMSRRRNLSRSKVQRKQKWNRKSRTRGQTHHSRILHCYDTWIHCWILGSIWDFTAQQSRGSSHFWVVE